MMNRNYVEAIKCLNSLQSNSQTLELIRKNQHLQLQEDVDDTCWIKLGYNISDLNQLNAIHITGTKGKGSTCSFINNILSSTFINNNNNNNNDNNKVKIGLYTSPHLKAVRERIRLNNIPLSESKFSNYFFQVWDKLNNTSKPPYFRFMTILAFHVFLQEKVDTAIIEVGVGGKLDSTNIIPYPIVTAISSIGLDHVAVLGNTIQKIALQKSGIYKPNVPALAIDQPAIGLDVLRSQATELGASSFNVVPELPELSTITLGLAGKHQRSNAALAIAVVQTFLSSPRLPPAFSSVALPSPSSSSSSSSSSTATTTSTTPSLPTALISPSPIPALIIEGLKTAKWPGRCQIASDPKEERIEWFLDGAHTVESLQCCGEWFGESTNLSSKKILIFNCTSGRSGLSLLGTLLSTLSESPLGTTSTSMTTPFDHVIFCTNTTYAGGISKGDLTSNGIDLKDLEELKTQHELASAWSELTSSSSSSSLAQDNTITTPTTSQVHIKASIEESISLARSFLEEEETMGKTGEKLQVLVTGSLHLVGGVMTVVEIEI